MSDYSDIIDLKYEKSFNHKHMSNHDRAAQFAPFAALTGYDDLVIETARIVGKKIILSDQKIEDINNKLTFLLSLKDNEIPIFITYFVKDKLKDGGSYKTISTMSIKVDEINKRIKVNNEFIAIDDLYDIKSDIFNFYEI